MGKQRERRDSRQKEKGPGGKSLAGQGEPGLFIKILLHRGVWAAALLFLLIVLAYSPALQCSFLWDDAEYLVNNPTLRTFQGLKEIWLNPRSNPQYYPMVFTSFWAEFRLWGLHPRGYHVVNILLHASSAVILMFALRKLRLPGAWFAGALFGLHPVTVESVAWVTERKNVLSGLFYLAAVLAYLRFALPEGEHSSGIPKGRGRLWRFYALAGFLFLCSLLSKTVTCTLPAALLLLLWWKNGRFSWRDALYLIPFFALGAAFGTLTAWLEKHHVGAMGEEWSLSFAGHILLAGRIPWFYAKKIFFPHNLTFIYPRFEVSAEVWRQSLYPLAAAAVLALFWAWRKRLGRGPLAAALFFAGTLLPALGFFNVYPMRFSFVADHFQYLASLGLIVLFAVLAARVLGRLRSWKKSMGYAVCGAILSLMGLLTWHQVQVYKDPERLWRHTLAKNPHAWIAHNNLGEILVAQEKLEDAIFHCSKALELNPNLPEAHGNLGNALYKKKEFNGAISHYRETLRLDPRNQKALSNMGAALEALGRYSEAVDSYNEALRINPRYPGAQYNLGNVLFKQRKLDEAQAHYGEAVRLDPKFAEAHRGLGMVFQERGEFEQGIASYRKALVLRPSWLEAANSLAWLLATQRNATARDAAEAVRLAGEVCRKTGSQSPEPLDTLAAAYARAGQYEDAVKAAEEALKLASHEGKAKLAFGIQKRIRLYREGKFFVAE